MSPVKVALLISVAVVRRKSSADSISKAAPLAGRDALAIFPSGFPVLNEKIDGTQRLSNCSQRGQKRWRRSRSAKVKQTARLMPIRDREQIMAALLVSSLTRKYRISEPYGLRPRRPDERRVIQELERVPAARKSPRGFILSRSNRAIATKRAESVQHNGLPIRWPHAADRRSPSLSR